MRELESIKAALVGWNENHQSGVPPGPGLKRGWRINRSRPSRTDLKNGALGFIAVGPSRADPFQDFVPTSALNYLISSIIF